MNRQLLRDDALRLADAFGSKRWDNEAGGEVDRILSSVFDRTWRRILNANANYRVSQRTPTSDAVTGRYSKADLNGSTGDTLERLYRVLAVRIDGQPYREQRLATYIDREDQINSMVWFEEGQSITALPLQLSHAADIWVNWIPARPVTYTADSVEVDFPDGYDQVLIQLGAARLLMKGGAETQASAELRQDIQEDYDEMLQDIARVSTTPMSMLHTDRGTDWGAE